MLGLANSKIFPGSISPIKNRWFIAAGLTALLSLRVVWQFQLYRCGFISFTADEFARTIMAARWARNPRAIWHGVWLPFHQYFLGFLLRLKWELLWTPRIIWIILGLTSIVLMYAFARRLFESPTIGVISAILLAVNPLHIWLSSTPLSELPYATAILACFLSFTLYLRRKKYIYLFTSAFLLLLANGFRYESWLISGVFSLYLVGEGIRRSWRGKARAVHLFASLTAALLPWILPLAWIIGNYNRTGNAFYFMAFNRDLDLRAFGSRRSYINFLRAFIKIDPVASVLSVAGLGACLFRYRRDRAVCFYVAATVIPFLVFSGFQGGRATLPRNYLRYLAPFIFFAYPAVASLIIMVINRIVRSQRRRVVALAVILGGVIVIQARASFQFVNDPAGAGLKVGEKIRSLRRQAPGLAQRPILIEVSDWQHLAIQVGANDISSLICDRQVLDVIKARRTSSLLLSDKNAVRNYLIERDVSCVVVKSPELRKVMEKDLELKSRGEVNGYVFYLIPPGFDKTESVESRVPK